MARLSVDQCHLLAKSKNYEEFIVNKDLMGFCNRRLGQKDSAVVLFWMAYYHEDSCLACKIIEEAKHITIGDTLFWRTYDVTESEWPRASARFKVNLQETHEAVRSWFAPH